MQHMPGHEEEMLEAMECCRPGSDDLADRGLAGLAAAMAVDPELADRFRRQQRADEAVRAAICDVPVPEGLARRLLERLGTAPAAASSIARGVEDIAPAGEAGASCRGRRRFSRRWLLAGAAALGAAAAVLAAVCMRMPSGKDYSPLAVCDEAADFFQNESPAPSHPLGEVSPPADFPLSCEVSPAAQVRGRRST
jgi:hypothetical protein